MANLGKHKHHLLSPVDTAATFAKVGQTNIKQVSCSDNMTVFKVETTDCDDISADVNFAMFVSYTRLDVIFCLYRNTKNVLKLGMIPKNKVIDNLSQIADSIDDLQSVRADSLEELLIMVTL